MKVENASAFSRHCGVACFNETRGPLPGSILKAPAEQSVGVFVSNVPNLVQMVLDMQQMGQRELVFPKRAIRKVG